MTQVKNSGSESATPSTSSSGYLSLSVDLSTATWKSVASHEVFTVTGLVRARLWVECTQSVTSTGGASTLQFGVEGATNTLIAATGEDDIDIGELWYDATPTTKFDAYSTVVFDYVTNGLDIGYEIAAEATTVGTLVFHITWEPLNSTGNVAIGAGGSL